MSRGAKTPTKSGWSFIFQIRNNLCPQKEQSEHNNTKLARPNRNNNGSFVLREVD